MTFYDFAGKKIAGIKEFIDLYEPSYFMGNPKAQGIIHSQSSRYVEENEIMPILTGHINSYSDFAKIMAWKIGKIKHLESEAANKIIYAADWQLCDEQNPMRYGKELQLMKLSDYILCNREELEALALDNPQECLRRIRNVNITGIGTVYLITILFFLSHGNYPIYDRFAMASLLAAEQGLSPAAKERVEILELPTKWERGFATICEKQYAEYIKRLDDLNFDYKNDRRLDRALWVYGHAFL